MILIGDGVLRKGDNDAPRARLANKLRVSARIVAVGDGSRYVGPLQHALHDGIPRLQIGAVLHHRKRIPRVRRVVVGGVDGGSGVQLNALCRKLRRAAEVELCTRAKRNLRAAARETAAAHDRRTKNFDGRSVAAPHDRAALHIECAARRHRDERTQARERSADQREIARSIHSPAACKRQLPAAAVADGEGGSRRDRKSARLHRISVETEHDVCPFRDGERVHAVACAKGVVPARDTCVLSERLKFELARRAHGMAVHAHGILLRVPHFIGKFHLIIAVLCNGKALCGKLRPAITSRSAVCALCNAAARVRLNCTAFIIRRRQIVGEPRDRHRLSCDRKGSRLGRLLIDIVDDDREEGLILVCIDHDKVIYAVLRERNAAAFRTCLFCVARIIVRREQHGIGGSVHRGIPSVRNGGCPLLRTALRGCYNLGKLRRLGRLDDLVRGRGHRGDVARAVCGANVQIDLCLIGVACRVGEGIFSRGRLRSLPPVRRCLCGICKGIFHA